jgi:hypothetical protein
VLEKSEGRKKLDRCKKADPVFACSCERRLEELAHGRRATDPVDIVRHDRLLCSRQHSRNGGCPTAAAEIENPLSRQKVGGPDVEDVPSLASGPKNGPYNDFT